MVSNYMSMADKKISICVIDDPIDVKFLEKIVGCIPDDFQLIQEHGVEFQFPLVSHGLLCEVLLIDALLHYQIQDQVQLIHYSIGSKTGKRDLQKIVTALNYCSSCNINLISMSIGIFYRETALEMIPILNKMKDTVIFCAAANNFKITYPAAFPHTIGVKRTINNQKQIAVVPEPEDGIEIIAGLSLPQIFLDLSIRNGYNTTDSNSVLPPRLCAKFAKQILRYETPLSKKAALDFFYGFSSMTNSIERYKLPDWFLAFNDESPPTIMLSYKSDFSSSLATTLAVQIQCEFEKRGYACPILSDLFSENDFINGRYHLEVNKKRECVMYYSNVVSASLLLVVVKEKHINEIPYDEKWKLENFDISSSKAVNNICKQILRLFN